MLILGEAHLRTVLAEYQLHYNTAPAAPGHRPARAPDDERVAPRAAVTDVGTQQIRRKPILNGLINEYTHAAWHTEDLQVTQPNPIFERDKKSSLHLRLPSPDSGPCYRVSRSTKSGEARRVCGVNERGGIVR